MQTNVRFHKSKLQLLNVMAAFKGQIVADYLGDLVEADAKANEVPAPKPQQPAQAA
ncbi:MAG: hypothetical protein ACFB0G_11395 [Leptolyngbyaceae cyanobacterium]